MYFNLSGFYLHQDHGNSTVTFKMSIITFKQYLVSNLKKYREKEKIEFKIINNPNSNTNTNPSKIQSQKQKHISFHDNVKYFYFDLDLPVLSQRPKEFKLVQVNKFSNRDSQSICLLEEIFIQSLEKSLRRSFITLEGYIIVRNFEYEKNLTVRYTLTDWKTFTDTEAFYINSKTQEWDRFAFFIKIDADLITKIDEIISLSFAIKYSYCNIVYWDNNEGGNYKFNLDYLQ